MGNNSYYSFLTNFQSNLAQIFWSGITFLVIKKAYYFGIKSYTLLLNSIRWLSNPSMIFFWISKFAGLAVTTHGWSGPES